MAAQQSGDTFANTEEQPTTTKGVRSRKNFQRKRSELTSRELPKALSTTSTPLTNDPLWQQVFENEGERGLTCEQSIKVFNADAAGYVALVEHEYHAISDCDNFVTKTVPQSAFAYFHHILWWYRAALFARKRGEASEAQERLIHFVNGYDIHVGAGAATYLSGMGDYTDGTGVKHYLSAREPNQEGHFGELDARTHRDYETLIAPLVSVNRVLSDCAMTRNNVEFKMPDGILPARGRPPVVRRAPNIETLVHADPNIQEPIEEADEEEDAVGPKQQGPQPMHLPTANLLGWRMPVAMNKNQAAEIFKIIKDPEEIEFQNNTFRVHCGLFEFVYRRLRECKRYKVVPIPKSTTGSIAQQLAWRPVGPVNHRNSQFISGEGMIVSRTMLPARVVAAARVFCYRAIRAGFDDDQEGGFKVHPWASLYWGRYRNVPPEWQGNRNAYLVRGNEGLFEVMPFATSIGTRIDAVTEFLNKFKRRMASIFSKNAMLYDRLDYYCLVCDHSFTTEDAALSHMLDVLHKEALKKCGYLEKLKKDFIRKFKGIYFCEPCSLTFPTLTKVELHIYEESHITARKKLNPFIREEKNQDIAFNGFLITNDAWNGCIEDTCVLCSTEFDDAASHKAIRSHILNLIKSDVVFDEDKSTVYRKIDEKSKQCLTCNEIIAYEIECHFTTKNHEEKYKLYDQTKNTTETQNGSVQVNGDINKETDNTNKDVKESTDKDVKKDDKKEGSKLPLNNETKNTTQTTAETQNGNVQVNGEINKEADKTANNDVKQSTDKDANKDDQKEDSKPPGKEKVKQKPRPSINKENAKELDKIYCKNLGAKNYITGEFGSKWCILCEWLLEEPSGDHIRSKHHQTLLKIHNEKLKDNNSYISSKDESNDESIPHDAVERFQKNGVNIDLINETAFCKKCSKNIDFNIPAIDKHIEEHAKTPVKKSPETLHSGSKSDGTEKTKLYTKPVLLGKQKRSPKAISVEEYAKQQGFTHNVADCSYYCRPCSRRLNTTLDDLQKHVASKIHTENTKQASKTITDKAPVKEALFSFIKTFELVDTMNEGCVIVINDKFWLNAFGFFLIAKKNERIFCHGCHIDLTHDNVVQHIIVTDYHRQIIDKCLLISSLENEFIREIKLDVYHCGYCNITENDWDDILDHIATAEHKRERTKAEVSRSRHRPNLYHRRSMKEIDDMIQQFVRRNP